MKAFAGILWKIAVALAGAVVIAMLALRLFLGSGKAVGLVRDIAGRSIAADLSFSDFSISPWKQYPRILLRIDSLCISYPHSRFESFDPAPVRSRLLDAGRAEESDTLLRLSRVAVSLSPWQLLAGRVRIPSLELCGLRLYAHAYDSTSANWIILPPSGAKENSGGLPWICIDSLNLAGPAYLVYTAVPDTVFTAARLKSLEAGLKVKVNRDELKLRRAFLNVESLFVHGRLPADTLAFRLERLRLAERGAQLFDASLKADAMLLTSAFGRMRVPVRAEAEAGFRKSGQELCFDLRRLDASVAHIPLFLKGKFCIGGGAVEMDASGGVRDCPLDTLLQEYGGAFLKDPSVIGTDARLEMDVEARGTLSDESVPQISAGVRIPESSVEYLTYGLKGRLGLLASASVSPQRFVSASLDEFKLHSEGLFLDAEGSVADLLGPDPRYSVSLAGNADIRELASHAKALEGVHLDGTMSLGVEAGATASQIRTISFPDGAVQARFSSPFVSMSVSADTIALRACGPEVIVTSGAGGLVAGLGVDSMFFKKGMLMAARAKSVRNKAGLRMEQEAGKLYPHLDFKTDDERLFLRMGPVKAGVSAVKMSFSARRRSRPVSERRRHFMDSLKRVYPGVPRDSLMYAMRRNSPRRALPDFLSEKDFRAYDIKIPVDSLILRYLDEWSPAGALSLDRAFVAAPSFPLRTRFGATDASFDEKELRLDRFSISSGTSDLSARGTLKGLFRTILGRGVLDLDLSMHSSLINANELIAAMNVVKKTSAGAYSDTEDDSAIVTDTLANAPVDSIPMMVVPANLLASVRLKADSLHFGFLQAHPLSAALKVRERTMQLSDVNIASNLGGIALDAFVATRTKATMNAGVDLKISDMPIDNVLRLLPGFNDFIPALKTFEGKANVELSATTRLDTAMNVVIPSLDGVARVYGHDMNISDAGKRLRTLTSLMLFKNKNIGPIGDMSVSASIHDSRLDIFPFLLSVDRYRLALSGMQGLDGSMDYYASILKSPFPIRFGVRVWATPSGKTRFALGRARFLNESVPVYSEQVDSVQINIAQAIKNIFLQGIRASSAFKDGPAYVYTPSREELPLEEQERMEQFIMETQQREAEEEFFDDFDAWLDKEITRDAKAIMKKR